MSLKLNLENGKRIILVVHHPGDPQPPVYERAITISIEMTPKRARELAVQLCEYANIVDPAGQAGVTHEG